jgi:hypothetical protein
LYLIFLLFSAFLKTFTLYMTHTVSNLKVKSNVRGAGIHTF